MKTNVVLFVDVFGCGGIERYAYNVCKYIDRSKFNISVLSTVSDDGSYFIKLLNDINVPIITLLNHKETNPVKRIKNGHKAFLEYIKKLDKKTIIHFNISNSIDMKYAVIAKKCGFDNLIYHSHNSDATSTLKRIAHKVFKPTRCRCASVNIACSEKAAIWLYSAKDIANKNFVIINNAIDAQQYEYRLELREKKRWELGVANELLIGHVGRYNVQKNHTFLIQIFQEILKKVPNAKLMLIGEGDLRDQTEARIQELGITDHVISISQTDEVNAYLQAMDVFVLPSLYEGLPFVLVESQAAALPTVASDTITREIKITEYLEYVPLESGATVWAEKAIKTGSKTRSSTYSQVCASGFDIYESIKRLEKIYDSLASGRRKLNRQG